MTHTKAAVISLAGVFGGIFTSFFGVWSDDILALLVLMAIDFITGIIVAGLFQSSPKTQSGGLSSKECLKGIAKKVCELLLVAAAYQADRLIGFDYARGAAVAALCVAEIISIMENAGAMGILPEPLRNIFSRVIDILNKKHDDNKKE